MFRRFVLTGLLIAFGWAGTAHALGLGDINLRSALNEPLDAEIALLSATPEELQNLTVNIATADVFERYGLDRPAFLSRIEFRVDPNSGGGVIKVRSSDPITEPFVTMLVEAVWPRGRLLREYTMLLDPPVFANQAEAQPAPRASSRPDPSRDSRPAPVQRAPEQAAPSRPAYDGDSYTVQRNDTLWEIAQRVRPDQSLTMNQVMLSLFQANPQAFAGNINLLNAGATLRIPSTSEVYGIGRSDALAEVRRQNSAWRQGSGAAAATTADSGSLRLLPPDSDADAGQVGSGTTAGTAAEPADAARLEQLERENAEQKRLIEVQSKELAQLRQRLEQQRLADVEAATDDVSTSVGVDLEDTTDAASDDEIFVDDSTDEAQAASDDAADAAAVVEEPVRPVVKAAPAPEKKSWLDQALGVLSSFWTWIGLGVVALLVLLPILARRRRHDDESTGTWEALEDFEADEDGTRDATSRLRALATDDESIVVVEADEVKGAPTVETKIETTPPAPITSATDTYSLEDTFSSETAINLDRSDPAAEADFHMAYGLYDQAADLLKGAIASDPQRRELKSKLAEVYFVWGNKDGFVEAAEQLHDDLGGESDDAWDKIKIMGQQIAPEHVLFTGAGASIESVDLDFAADGGMGELGAGFGSDAADALDIDVGATFADDGLLADDNALDFSFDEVAGETDIVDQSFDLDMGVAVPDDSEGPTIERLGEDAATTQETPTVESLGPDAPTIESLGPDAPTMESLGPDAPTVESLGPDAPTVESPAADIFSADENTAEIPLMEAVETDRADSTAEINLDDLGLDLSGLDTGDDSGELELPDIGEFDIDSSIESRGIDEDSLDSFDDFSAGSEALSDEPDFGASVTVLVPPSADSGGDAETESGTPSLTGADMDLDLDDLTAALQRQDYGETSVIDSDSDATQERPLESPHKGGLGDDIFADSMTDEGDLDLDLGPASNDDDDAPTVMPADDAIDVTGNRTMTEVGTKLDLARAYIDMGDPDGARSILKEVTDEGDSAQQQEARKLLDSLG